jgi:hypothetical protein
MEKSAHKLELLRRIAELEKKQLWHLDVEDDPETYPLMPEDVDYLNEKLSSRIKNKIANIFGARFFDKLIADRQLIIKEVRGIENFKAVEGGKIVTCNHFSVGDNYAVWVALRDHMDGKLLYKVIREGNYTNPPKPFGLFMRHCNTLPLSSQLPTMKKFLKAVEISDIVKFSHEKISDISFVDQYSDKLFIRTLGAEGLEFNLCGKGWVKIDSVPNDNVVDWEGAGDWTTSQFIACLCEKDILSIGQMSIENIRECLEKACQTASRSVSYLGSKGMIEAEKSK